MRRGLLLFLAVALCGWFAPNVGALTRTPAVAAPHYDEADAVLVVVLGDGITMDTFQGNQKDLLSLHKYLYAADNPVNKIDPSGLDGLDSMPNLAGAISSHLVDDLIQAVVWHSLPGGGYLDPNYYGYAPVTIFKGTPENSKSMFAPDGETFLAPQEADFQVEFNTGKANGRSLWKVNENIGQYGKFDFQRNRGQGWRDEKNIFYTAYTDASNYGVGVYMNGAGFSLQETVDRGKLFAFFRSSNAKSQRPAKWWKLGWNAAQSGSANGPTPGH